MPTKGIFEVSENLFLTLYIIFTFQASNYGTWNKRKKHSDWSSKKTVKFYKALSVFGTDFSLMQGVFKKKTRTELRLKFKKEERLNKRLVEKCLSQGQIFDPSIFDSDEETDSEAEEKQKEELRNEKKKEKAKEKAEERKREREKKKEEKKREKEKKKEEKKKEKQQKQKNPAKGELKSKVFRKLCKLFLSENL